MSLTPQIQSLGQPPLWAIYVSTHSHDAHTCGTAIRKHWRVRYLLVNTLKSCADRHEMCKTALPPETLTRITKTSFAHQEATR